MLTDEEIVALYFGRYESAISETANKYRKYCFTIVNNVLDDAQDSEECVNDILLKLWYSIPPENPRSFRAYISKIARNIALDKYRMRNAAKRGSSTVDVALSELEECLPGGPNPEHELEKEELAELINSFLRKIPARDANIFICRYFEVRPVSQIAEKFRISENNVTVILSRVRKKLQKHLTKEGYINES
jgi:RNA polymerase sigma-70 factor (ECF subfamily)